MALALHGAGSRHIALGLDGSLTQDFRRIAPKDRDIRKGALFKKCPSLYTEKMNIDTHSLRAIARLGDVPISPEY